MSEAARKDPLAGYREEINRGDRDFVSWPDDGTGCPVEVGEVFPLRACRVQVSHTKRRQHGRRWLWVAWFRVLRPDTTQMLAKGKGDGHGYIEDDRASLGSGQMVEERDVDDKFLRIVEAPEPEAIHRDEVKNLPTTVAARARYEEQHQITIRMNLDRSIASQLREVGVRARNTGVDLGTEYEELEDLLARMKDKVRAAA